MQYRSDKYGKNLSILGYGCMRFSRKGIGIDLEKTEKEVMYAINHGVNYLDTAYIYPGSEAALGQILEKNNCRDKVYIATKLPQYLIKSKKALDKYFNEQLERLKTDHIDYYLMHMLTDIAAWEKLKQLEIEEWIAEKKAQGKITNIGFSYHGNSDMFIEILKDYPWDFCQIQYNYLDEHSQAGRKGLMAAAERKIPVIIMEPLRGGKLVGLMPDSGKKLIKEHEKKWSAAEWAFRWLWNQPQVTCVLSGMNSTEMVEENIRIASECQVDEFTQDDFNFIEKVKNEINKKTKVGCTACGYCMPCPKGIDIPTTFKCYNHMYTENKKSGRNEYFQITALKKDMADLGDCIECGKCEMHCPQGLPIRKHIKDARKALTPWYRRFLIKLIRLFKFW